jgi:predicted RNase H-like HicB family nuclease
LTRLAPGSPTQLSRCLGWVSRLVSRYRVGVSEKLRLTIAFEEPDEEGWIVAQVVEVPGAVSQGRTRSEARENVIDALRLMLSPDDGAASDETLALEVLLPA